MTFDEFLDESDQISLKTLVYGLELYVDDMGTYDLRYILWRRYGVGTNISDFRDQKQLKNLFISYVNDETVDELLKKGI